MSQIIKPRFKITATSMVAKAEPLLSVDQSKSPSVWYSNKAWLKIKRVVGMCPEEVGWLGTVDRVDGGYIVTDIFVPKQVVTGTECDIEAEDLAQLVHDLDYPENLFYWGHSHVNMGVSPSVQDENQTGEYLEHNDVFIRGIYNKRGDSKVDVFDTVQGMQYLVCPNGVRIEPLSSEEMEAFVTGVKANVNKPPAYVTPYVSQQEKIATDKRLAEFKAKNKRGTPPVTTRFHNSPVTALYENPFIVLERDS